MSAWIFQFACNVAEQVGISVLEIGVFNVFNCTMLSTQNFSFRLRIRKKRIQIGLAHRRYKHLWIFLLSIDFSVPMHIIYIHICVFHFLLQLKKALQFTLRVPGSNCIWVRTGFRVTTNSNKSWSNSRNIGANLKPTVLLEFLSVPMQHTSILMQRYSATNSFCSNVGTWVVKDM